MRQELESWLNAIWYGGQRPPAWLQLLVPLYRAGFLLERKWQTMRRPAALIGRPILVVGNLTVGGTGKTPLVIRLCRLLQQAGLRAGVVTRGYGRKGRDLLEVSSTSLPAETGDEPLVIARRTGVPVVVAADRCAAAQHLFDLGVDIVIADDGLQHHRLPRTVEICMVDGEREFGNGRQLPAGPLREPLSRLRRTDFVVIHGDGQQAIGIERAVRMHLMPGLLYALAGTATWRLSQFSGCRVNAVAGIAHPARFFSTLQHAGLQVQPHVFPDHHAFVAEDFAKLGHDLPIIMTEKDAVKCRTMKLENAWYLAVEASLPSAWEIELLARLGSNLAGNSAA